MNDATAVAKLTKSNRRHSRLHVILPAMLCCTLSLAPEVTCLWAYPPEGWLVRTVTYVVTATSTLKQAAVRTVPGSPTAAMRKNPATKHPNAAPILFVKYNRE